MILVMLLALPAWIGSLGADPVAGPVPDCQQALVLTGDLSRPGLVCRSSPADPYEPIPTGCKEDSPWPPSSQVVLERSPDGTCRAKVGPLTGAQGLLLGLGIDPNSANDKDLQLMPGIGPALSKRILEYRSTHGCFENIEALIRVSGIGPKTLERIRPFIQLGKCPMAGPAATR